MEMVSNKNLCLEQIVRLKKVLLTEGFSTNGARVTFIASWTKDKISIRYNKTSIFWQNQ
jgi:hypothetical protein